MSGTLYLGTSGFAYKEWKGIFYPQDLKDAEMLPFYASRFPSVEINYTFRRVPAESTLTTWRDRTPEGFRFTLKAHQRITHRFRLREPAESMPWFLERIRLLGDRLGPVLFQCPPSLRYDREVLEGFLEALPDGLRCAMEFRHPSWEEARPLLAERGVAWCVSETDEAGPAEQRFPSQPFGYLRLRLQDYTDERLKAWAEAIQAATAGGSDVYCYFKHEEDVPDEEAGPYRGPTAAQALQEKVRLLSER